jgi:hypothetical protein
MSQIKNVLRYGRWLVIILYSIYIIFKLIRNEPYTQFDYVFNLVLCLGLALYYSFRKKTL